MSTTDKAIILASILGMALLFGSAATLMPRINDTRVDLQLTANDQTLENLPPDIAVTQAALGAFRGLAVDVLWARINQMKRDGQFHEAMQLADWITKLQPRFPEVWQFHAWNMSYNISVATHTPRERWMWVSAGIDLLRERGIPLNPNAVALYKELGWIFLHKVGQYTDDMHWHYKQRLAAEWNNMLGAPPEGSAEDVLAWFEPVAAAYEDYVNTNSLTRDLRDQLDTLAKKPRLREHLDPLRPLTLQQFDVELRNVRETLAEESPELYSQTAILREMADKILDRAGRDPVQRLLDDHPEIAELLDTLRGMNLQPNAALLRRISQARAVRDSLAMRAMNLQERPDQVDVSKRLRAWLNDKSIADRRETLLAFVRARAIHEKYRMDPLWMLELMKGEWFVRENDRARLADMNRLPRIPIDWRHPAAHGLYWASLGVRRSQNLVSRGDRDVLNTDRQILHALQQLTRTGEIVYDPVSGYYRQMPDPRFVDAYHHAQFGASERIFSERLQNSTAPESFKSGHENFLIWAVEKFYFYGDMEKARSYYDQLRDMYADFRPDRVERYAKPLEDFVFHEFASNRDITTLDDARSVIAGYINRAINDGLANGRSETAERFLKLARRAHDMYQNKQDYYTPSDGRNRMALPDFDELLATVFTNFLLNEPTDPLMKARAWHNAPLELRTRIFSRDQFRNQLYAQAQQMGLNAEAAFPAPPGFQADAGDGSDSDSSSSGSQQQDAGLPSGLGAPELLSRPEEN